MKLFTHHSSFFFYLLTMLLVTALDVWAGNDVNLWIFYGIPIGLATWNLGRRPGFFLAFIGVVLVAGSAVIWGHPYSSLGKLAFACASKATVYLVLVGLVAALRRKEVERTYSPTKSRK